MRAKSQEVEPEERYAINVKDVKSNAKDKDSENEFNKLLASLQKALTDGSKEQTSKELNKIAESYFRGDIQFTVLPSHIERNGTQSSSQIVARLAEELGRNRGFFRRSSEEKRDNVERSKEYRRIQGGTNSDVESLIIDWAEESGNIYNESDYKDALIKSGKEYAKAVDVANIVHYYF